MMDADSDMTTTQSDAAQIAQDAKAVEHLAVKEASSKAPSNQLGETADVALKHAMDQLTADANHDIYAKEEAIEGKLGDVEKKSQKEEGTLPDPMHMKTPKPQLVAAT